MSTHDIKSDNPVDGELVNNNNIIIVIVIVLLLLSSIPYFGRCGTRFGNKIKEKDQAFFQA